MAQLEYNGLGAEWHRTILEIEQLERQVHIFSKCMVNKNVQNDIPKAQL